MEKQSNNALILLTFVHALKNGQKLANFHLYLKRKFTVIHEGFLGPKLSVWMKFHLVLSHLGPKSFASRNYCSILMQNDVIPSVSMLNVAIPSVVMPNVMAPQKERRIAWGYTKWFSFRLATSLSKTIAEIVNTFTSS